MKKCTHCGAANFDMSTICERCQQPLGEDAPVTVQNKGLKKASKMFWWIGTIGYWAIFLSALLGWFVSLFLEFPILTIVFFGVVLFELGMAVLSTYMAKIYFKKVASGIRVGTGFKVCTLIFVNLFAGIIMLCDNE